MSQILAFAHGISRISISSSKAIRPNFRSPFGSSCVVVGQSRFRNGTICQGVDNEQSPEDKTGEKQQGPDWLNLPNLLTISRVLAVPILAASLLVPNLPRRKVIATSLFVAAAITDYLDGKLARMLKQYSDFGAFLDPVADKLMVCTTLIALTAQYGTLVGIPAALVVFREITISALREFMAGKGQRESVAVGFQGKVKTAAQMVSLTILLATSATSSLFKFGIIALYISTLLTWTSALGYVKAALPILLK